MYLGGRSEVITSTSFRGHLRVHVHCIVSWTATEKHDLNVDLNFCTLFRETLLTP